MCWLQRPRFKERHQPRDPSAASDSWNSGQCMKFRWSIDIMRFWDIIIYYSIYYHILSIYPGRDDRTLEALVQKPRTGSIARPPASMMNSLSWLHITAPAPQVDPMVPCELLSKPLSLLQTGVTCHFSGAYDLVVSVGMQAAVGFPASTNLSSRKQTLQPGKGRSCGKQTYGPGRSQTYLLWEFHS